MSPFKELGKFLQVWKEYRHAHELTMSYHWEGSLEDVAFAHLRNQELICPHTGRDRLLLRLQVKTQTIIET